MPSKAPRPVGREPDRSGLNYFRGQRESGPSLIQNRFRAQAQQLRRQRWVDGVHRLGPHVPYELSDESVRHHGLAVTEQQIHHLSLPTHEPKRNTSADKKWPLDFACELDTIPPDYMRALVQAAIERHLPADRFKILKAAEASERTIIRQLVDGLGAPA
jgi:hypothetical protein